jgi:NADH:ubiquinone oxidoreductase subunit E
MLGKRESGPSEPESPDRLQHQDEPDEELAECHEKMGKKIKGQLFLIHHSNLILEGKVYERKNDWAEIDGIIDANGQKTSAIIAILQGVQEKYRYLPREVFPYLVGAA